MVQPKHSRVPEPEPAPPPLPEEADLAARNEDPQQVGEYAPDIYRHLQREEGLQLPAPTYMDRQPQVNAKMRAILVDWLVDVHKKYKLRPETLFLAIGLIDRFLEKKQTLKRHLQLVGVTGLLIAAKFEEMYPPQIQDFVYVTDKAYTKDEVIKMEVCMLTVLEFKICRPTAFSFAERYQFVNGCTEAQRDLVQYILELSLVDYKMVKYSPSHLAAAAVLASNKLLRRLPAWTPANVKHTKLTEQMLRDCVRDMVELVEQAQCETTPLQAVRKKYSQLKHHAVSKLNFAQVPPAPAPTVAAAAGAAVVESRLMRTAAALTGRRSMPGSLPRRPEAALGQLGPLAPLPLETYAGLALGQVQPQDVRMGLSENTARS